MGVERRLVGVLLVDEERLRVVLRAVHDEHQVAGLLAHSLGEPAQMLGRLLLFAGLDLVGDGEADHATVYDFPPARATASAIISSCVSEFSQRCCAAGLN